MAALLDKIVFDNIIIKEESKKKEKNDIKSIENYDVWYYTK